MGLFPMNVGGGGTTSVSLLGAEIGGYWGGSATYNVEVGDYILIISVSPYINTISTTGLTAASGNITGLYGSEIAKLYKATSSTITISQTGENTPLRDIFRIY